MQDGTSVYFEQKHFTSLILVLIVSHHLGRKNLLANILPSVEIGKQLLLIIILQRKFFQKLPIILCHKTDKSVQKCSTVQSGEFAKGV